MTERPWLKLWFKDTRLLITLAKFDQLKSTSLPSMVSRIGKLLDLDVTKDQGLLMEVVENMDQMVFEDYVKRRSQALVQVIQDGVLNGGIDWLDSPKPTGISILIRRLRSKT